MCVIGAQAAARRSKMDKDDEERSQKMIEEQIARALATKDDTEEVWFDTVYMYIHLCIHVYYCIELTYLQADK